MKSSKPYPPCGAACGEGTSAEKDGTEPATGTDSLNARPESESPAGRLRQGWQARRAGQGSPCTQAVTGNFGPGQYIQQANRDSGSSS